MSVAAAHEQLVAAQFGPRARAYVDSVDHATGSDLARLAALAAARPGCRVLDVGCGGGHVSYAVAPHAGAVTACDLSADMLAAVSAEAAARGLANIRTERAAAEALPFPDGAFDLVLTRFSAHHWRNLDAGLAAMRRVLRPDGLAVVVDVVGSEDPLHDTVLQAIELLRDPSHVRDRSVPEWLAALRRAGFRPREPILSRLPLRFDAWIARMATPAPTVAAIRALQSGLSPDVSDRLDLRPDGSFTLDVVLIEAEPV
ncbi:MAG: class I SAM-dependent methyltransferase [Gluconacetobacter diazotrophicus]|nr:class I SAM-dependent methyltransferase [Gluconacetobacter diazotrophicus]